MHVILKVMRPSPGFGQRELSLCTPRISVSPVTVQALMSWKIRNCSAEDENSDVHRMEVRRARQKNEMNGGH